MRLAVLLVGLSTCLSAQAPLTRADQARSRGDLAAEKTLLEEIARSASIEDRAEAERRLALLAWRYYRDDKTAEVHFGRAEATGATLCATLAARARFATARSRFGLARDLSRRALKLAANRKERDLARIAFAHATVEEAFERGTSPATQEALQLIVGTVREEPGSFVPARLMYGLAVLVHDKGLEDEALRAYYWGGKTHPLYPEAALAGRPLSLVQYGRFCRRAAAVADEHYRLRALGQATWEQLEPLVRAEAKRLYPQLNLSSSPFGTVLAFFRFGMEFGHRVQDEQLVYDQHGHKASVRAVVVDSMISNGYITWLTDGREAIGGWADNPIIRVRRDDAIRNWNGEMDPERRAEFDAEMQRRTAEDDETARNDPYAYLKGLHLRLIRRANRELLSELERNGLRGPDLRVAFLYAWQSREDRCLYAHEARHLIEPESAPYNREMSAAVARVLFGHPTQGLMSIIAPNIAKRDGGSGEGNWRIMQGIVRWMEQHAAEIRELDRFRPLLPQFDLLTNEQMRAAFLTLDPLAK
jgi:hypothetical protein